MKEYTKERGLSCIVSFLVPCILMTTSIASVSCKMTAEGIVSQQEDVSPPAITSFSQVNNDSLLLNFSEEVNLSNMEVRSASQATLGSLALGGYQLEAQAVSLHTAGESIKGDAGGMSVSVRFSEDHRLAAGESYVLSGVAHDQDGNSLLFQLPFHGYNDDVAGLVLSEVRSGYSKPKVEYLEFYVYKKGNLAGINLYTANKDFEYVFPPVEVEAGDYVVLHMRALESEAGRVDEVGSDLNLSTAMGSCQDARDLWVSHSKRIVGTKDVIVLRERFGGKIMDSLLYIHPDISDAEKKRIVPIAQQVLDEGAWSGSTDFSTWASGEDLSETATTRSLSRQKFPAIVDAKKEESPVIVGSSTDWMVVKGATPGQPNSTDKYVAKAK